LVKVLPDILKVIPKEWDGTTFNNSNLLGRPNWSKKFIKLVEKSVASGMPITEADLTNLGNAQDYLRVSTNISTVLETALALKHNRDVEQIFTFASHSMPVFAVMMNGNNNKV